MCDLWLVHLILDQTHKLKEEEVRSPVDPQTQI